MSPRAWKAPTERSIDSPLPVQVGQTSATMAETVLPLSVLTISTHRPQSGEALE